MPINPLRGAENLFQIVFGRGPESPQERSFLRDLPGRKPGAAEQFGAIQFRKQEGTGLATTAPQAQPKEPTLPTARTTQPQTPTDQTPTDALGSIQSILEVLKVKALEIDKAKKSVMTEQERLAIRKEILSGPEFKRLQEAKAELAGQVQEREFDLGGEEGVGEPGLAGRLRLQARGDLARGVSRITEDLRTREASVDQILRSQKELQQQQVDIAQQDFQNTRALLQDILSVRADQRAAITSGLQNQKLRSDLEGGIISNETLLELGAEFGAEGLAELQSSLGLPGTFPFAQNVTGIGYQNGDLTKFGTLHKGVDQQMVENTPLRTPLQLTVTRVFRDPKGGLTIYATDERGTTHKFLHLNQALVAEGDVIQPGELFALSGNTGSQTTGPHLHYELQGADGVNIDPREYALPGQSSFVSRQQQKANVAKVGAEDDLRKEFTKQSGPFIAIAQSIQRVRDSARDPSAAGDLALIFNFMKILDPGSVVREGEFATAAASAGLSQRLIAAAKRVDSGQRLAPEQRKDFLDRAEVLFKGQIGIQQNLKIFYKSLAEGRGLNVNNIIINFEEFGAGVGQQVDQTFTGADSAFVSGFDFSTLGIPPTPF